METPKILITVSGGQVVSIASSIPKVDIVIIDEDIPPTGDGNGISPIMEPDSFSVNMYELYDESTPRDKEIRDELKRMKF